MINKKNKPAGLNISQFVENSRQNIRPVGSISPEVAAENTEEKTETNSVTSSNELNSPGMQAEIADDSSKKETEEVVPSVSDEKKADEPASEEEPKRKRSSVQQKAIKREKLMAIRFDKKMHKDISLIKLNYEIDIQDFVYIAVDKFMGEFFPNGKATKEGMEIVQQSLEKIYGKKSED